mmetsp:Transcript_31984/g.56540  ORF Transcript_31984/g.56540 Transcript_31984/m.56540 type:complete len:441 (-) Transcript_31984:40-1362(-)
MGDVDAAELAEISLYILKSEAYEVFIDIIVFSNAVAVGFEVDNNDFWVFEVARYIFCGVYVLEILTRLVVHGPAGMCSLRILLELAIALVAVLGVFGFPDIVLMWRLSVLRCIRFLRWKGFARTCSPLHDLWLVLMGITKALKALAWLAVLLSVVLYAGGSVVRTLVSSDLEDKVDFPCGGDDFRIHLTCIDHEEYFGSLFRSWFTMLQVATLDRWASHIVRPMFDLSPVTAVVIVIFVLTTTYGLLSIAVGVLVWSTVDLAQAHQDHRTRLEARNDDETIKTLREYFYNSLAIEDKENMDYRDLKEGLDVPGVRAAWKALDLPVTDMGQLWQHLDPMGKGEISLREFEKGCRRLKDPASRLDMACLAAKLNGNAVRCGDLDARCVYVSDDMETLCSILGGAFTHLRQYVLSDEVNENIPEVGLRRAGMMSKAHLFGLGD